MLDTEHRPRHTFALADVLGVDFVSEENGYVCNYVESAGHPMAKLFGLSTVGFGGPLINVRRTQAEAVMRYRLPVMTEDLSKNRWYNWGPPPPGERLGGPAVTTNCFGRGRAVYLGPPVFRSLGAGTRANWVKQWIPDLIRQTAPYPIAELRASPDSEFIHGTFFYEKQKRFVLVQILDTLATASGGELRPGPKVSIRVNSAKLNVHRARTIWPKSQDLPVVHRGGESLIELANWDTYAMVCLACS